MSAREFCGVVGVVAPQQGAAPILYRGLRALQHRGQESAGIVTSSHGRLYTRKGMGLVHEVFDQESIDNLRGSVGIGHVRYSTTGSSDLENAQPISFKMREEEAAIAHNGDLVNYARVRHRLQAQGVELLGNADTETMGQLIALEYGRSRDLEGAIRRARNEVIGGYAVVMVVGSHLVAFRDPLGIRPLALGTLDGGHCIASESVAIDFMGGKFVREVAPGELLIFDRTGKLRSTSLGVPDKTAHCMFEWVYFSRPDSWLGQHDVYAVRSKIGARLARESPVEADLVIPVPDSSRPQALGFSAESGIPYAEGLIKNRFVERTFILPDQRKREAEVRVKLHPVPSLLRGKRIVLVDDSIVRGTTLREILSMVRAAGATRVDVRIGCPPIVAPCYFGVDMKQRRDLVAAGRTEEEVAAVVGADSVHYLSMEGLVESIGLAKSQLCLGCLTGRYPLEVPEERQRFQRTLPES